MSQYYNSNRLKNTFDVNSKTPFRLSRSKIELYINCPRCFYLDRRLGVARPPGFPFNLNNAVDELLKKEFDIHRARGSQHPLMKHYKINAIPFRHDRMDEWRDALRGGITYLHKPTNFFVTGGIDDIWVNPKNELIIVDYKATSKKSEVNLDADWQIAYKRQVEVYQWLFRKNDFRVSNIAYFVYCNGNTDRETFDARLEFDISILPYEGDDSWIEDTLVRAHECLKSDELPKPGRDCDFCNYRAATLEAEKGLT